MATKCRNSRFSTGFGVSQTKFLQQPKSEARRRLAQCFRPPGHPGSGVLRYPRRRIFHNEVFVGKYLVE